MSVRRRLAQGVAVALLLAACSAKRVAAPDAGAVLYDGGIAQLVPLHAGDWFVYRTTSAQHGVRFERSELTATKSKDELLLTVRDGDTEVARVQLRLVSDAILVVSEVDVGHDVGAIYATPLPLFSVPVRERAHAGSTVRIVRLSDGNELDHGTVELTVTSMRDPTNGDIISQVDRRLLLSGGDLPAVHQIWIRPGVGQIATQSPDEQRELVCASVGGKTMGTCPA